MTDEHNEIADFRSTHGEALFNNSHAEHSTRVKELFDLTVKHYGAEPISDGGFIRSQAVDSHPEQKSTSGVPSERPTLAPEAAEALKAQITAYRNLHSASLYDSGHAEHERRLSELTELTARLHGNNPANDQVTGHNTKSAAIMDEAMKPLKSEEFQVGALSDFGKSLPAYEEWNGELETEVRGYMANAEFNEGSARGVMAAFRESMAQDFSQEHSDINHDKSVSYLLHTYGAEGLTEAITASNRVVAEVGGQKLKDLLRETGLGNHPAIVYEFARLAERKGYIKRKSAQP